MAPDLMDTMTDWGSFWRGVRAWRPLISGHVNYGMWRVRRGGGRFWCEVWTPIWHQSRGPYVSIGLGFFAIGRGY